MFKTILAVMLSAIKNRRRREKELLEMIRTIICNSYKFRLSGMTLIELVVVLAILGVVTAVSYPAYVNHTLKSHRTIALTDISRIQLELEANYNGQYDWSTLISQGRCLVCNSDRDRFTFSVASSATESYIISATAKPERGQSNDKCFPNRQNTITLTSSNVASPSACWE
ncbi:fimbrial assembly protein PilE [Vibrio rotiferianus CAIM 577 = LMG 21460]|jgi:type IV pilus assembly protein PilE|nr:fimbrial assembly protein PilE [Vibrio rotiferianus CAIM 577 = LMG 21460]